MNLRLLEYSLTSLKRNFFKNIFILVVLTLMTWLLASMFFITNSMKYELNTTLDALPDIIVQKKKAGIHSTIDESVSMEILEIPGVESAHGRVWGYYNFENAETYFTLMGVDEFETQSRDILVDVVENHTINNSSMLVGKGVLQVLKMSYYKEYFNFIKEDGSLKKMFIAGVFTSGTELESNDVIVMDKMALREIFGFQENEATDIAVNVTNKIEVPMVALKITQNYPNYRVLTKDDMRVSYENLFNYKNGLFLGLFIVSIFIFFVIVYDKLTGMSSVQKREVGILKALGWRVEDILKSKLYESLFISLFAYMLGVFMALTFVYIFNAPLLKDVFLGYTEMKPMFNLLFVFDFETLFLLFFLSVPIYVAATIIPSWRVATLDADEVMR
jgi:ABC-type lipoprotein release transport system permease subunit